MPASFLESTNDFIALSSLARRSAENPTNSGLVSGISLLAAAACDCFAVCAERGLVTASSASIIAPKTLGSNIGIFPRSFLPSRSCHEAKPRDRIYLDCDAPPPSPDRVHSSRMARKGVSTGMSDLTDQRVGTDRAALLNQLRIDRSEPPSSGGHGKWWATGIAVIIIAASAIWYLNRPTGAPITTAVAQAVASGAPGASAGPSLLDASGYIVARRRATVSSKVTGKVAQVMLEEGQRVRRDRLLRAWMTPIGAQHSTRAMHSCSR